MSDVTTILNAVEAGDRDAASQLLPLVYEELRRLARAQMGKERAEHTLQVTALVHEAYLRLVGDGQTRWDGRGHFFGAAAEAMRRSLVEPARRKKALKHGGERLRAPIEDDLPPTGAPCESTDDLLALNEALERLEHEDARKAELVKLLYFAGLNLEEAAAALNISRTTAYRRWLLARAWLYEAINGADSADDGAGL